MSRNACSGKNGETGEKSPASGDLNWMPKMAPWRLAILAKMAILAKLAILAKIAMHAMAKLAKNHQPLAIWIGCQKWPLGGWRFWQKWRFWRNWRFWQKLPCMQWRKWRKITSLWQFELDAKSGPLEAGDFGENGHFGEIGDFGKNRQWAGDIQNVAKYSNWMPKVAPSK